MPTTEKTLLREAAEALTGVAGQLVDVLEAVREEVGLLHAAIDDLRHELSWAARNAQSGFVLTSMPCDPAAPDWSARLNQFTAADVPESELAEQCPQQTLFE